MVMGNVIAFRCKQCNEVFFKAKNDVLNILKDILKQTKCPKCGSKDVFIDKTIHT